MRHLIIIDLRSEESFNASHIRKAIRVEPTATNIRDQLAGALLSNRDERFRSHYSNDDLTRALFVLPAGQAVDYERLITSKLAEVNERLVSSSANSIQLHKAFTLKDFDGLAAKYPLVCLPEGQVTTLREVRALSRFPSELKTDKLFVGNMTNLMNRDYFQLTMLKIKTIFYMSKGPFEDIDQHFNCIHVPCNEIEKPLLDFEMLSQKVQSLMNDPQTSPVLVLCCSG